MENRSILQFLAILTGMVLAAAALSLWGCGGVPFEPCSTPGARQCGGSEVRQCQGGYWYPDLDCADVGAECKMIGGRPDCIELGDAGAGGVK